MWFSGLPKNVVRRVDCSSAASGGTRHSVTSAGARPPSILVGSAAHLPCALTPRPTAVLRAPTPPSLMTRCNLCTPSLQVCGGDCSERVARIQLRDQRNQQMASELYLSLENIYKTWDYRCLVPYSQPDPGKWHTYDMHKYRTAFDKDMLENVDTFKYDNNFNNWIDPKVMREYTRSNKHLKEVWKDSYSAPFATGLHWDGTNLYSDEPRACWRRCAQLVRFLFLPKSFLAGDKEV